MLCSWAGRNPRLCSKQLASCLGNISKQVRSILGVMQTENTWRVNNLPCAAKLARIQGVSRIHAAGNAAAQCSAADSQVYACPVLTVKHELHRGPAFRHLVEGGKAHDGCDTTKRLK